MRDLPKELSQAHFDGRYHDYIGLKIEQLEALHAAGKAADKTYRGDSLEQHIEMMKACDLAMWQMKESLGYPIPYAVDERYPRKLAGCAGDNPFKCGKCGAREAYPDLHLKHDAERHGGLYVAPDKFLKA